MKKLLIPLLAAVAMTVPLPASALLCLVCSCTVSTTAVAFGLYAPLSAPPNLSTGNISVSCTATASVLVNYTIDLGTGNSSSYSPRLMGSGSNRLGYNLFTDSARTSVWGNGTGGTGRIVSGDIPLTLFTGSTVNYPVYGRIPGSQKTVPPGSYNDAVQVTVTY